MNKTKTILLVIAVVLVLVVFGVLGFNKKIVKAPTAVPVDTSSTISSTSSSSPSGLIVSTSTETFYTGPSFSFVYPKPWTYVPAADFSIDTFGGKYQSDGSLPAGGAEVDVVTTTIQGSVKNIMDTELMNAVDLTTATTTVDKTSCKKATFEDNYAVGSTSKDISIYCAQGTELWKIYLSYGANDPAGNTHISDFNGMVTSMKLL